MRSFAEEIPYFHAVIYLQPPHVPTFRRSPQIIEGQHRIGVGREGGLVKSCQTVVMFLVQSDVSTSVTFLSLFCFECLGWMCKMFVCASLEF